MGCAQGVGQGEGALVQRGAQHELVDRGRLAQPDDVLEVGHTTGGGHRRPDQRGDGGEKVEVGTGAPTVPGGVGDEHAHGYVLAAADSRAFEAALEQRWWPALRERYPLDADGRTEADQATVALLKLA